MSKLTPLKTHELISKLRKIGVEGPFPGGRHSRMVNLKTGQIVPIPIHTKEVGVGLIRKIINQVGLTRDEWIEL